LKAEKKVTVMLPAELLDRALKASGQGLTATLRKGLELISARDTYNSLLKLKEKFDFKIDLADSRRDRGESGASLKKSRF